MGVTTAGYYQAHQRAGHPLTNQRRERGYRSLESRSSPGTSWDGLEQALGEGGAGWNRLGQPWNRLGQALGQCGAG